LSFISPRTTTVVVTRGTCCPAAFAAEGFGVCD
jgi:hypothetical protein